MESGESRKFVKSSTQSYNEYQHANEDLILKCKLCDEACAARDIHNSFLPPKFLTQTRGTSRGSPFEWRSQRYLMIPLAIVIELYNHCCVMIVYASLLPKYHSEGDSINLNNNVLTGIAMVSKL